MPRADNGLSIESVAARWRTLAQRFGGAEASSRTPAILKHNLDAHCVCAGWLLIDGFATEALPLRDEWRAELDHCVSVRESDGGLDRSDKAAGNFFRGIVAEWLIRDAPDRVRHTPCLTVSVVSIVPIPKGKTAVEAIRDADECEPFEGSTGIDQIKVGGDWIDASPQSAETWADACDVLAVLAGGSAAVRRHIEDDEVVALHKDDVLVLMDLDRNAPLMRTIDDIAGATPLGRKAAINRLKHLIELDLAKRPNGKNSGATITPAGKAQLIKLAGTQSALK